MKISRRQAGRYSGFTAWWLMPPAVRFNLRIFGAFMRLSNCVSAFHAAAAYIDAGYGISPLGYRPTIVSVVTPLTLPQFIRRQQRRALRVRPFMPGHRHRFRG